MDCMNISVKTFILFDYLLLLLRSIVYMASSQKQVGSCRAHFPGIEVGF